MLSHRENVFAMLSGQGAERLPVDVWTTEPALDLIEAHTGSRNVVEALDLSFENVGVRLRDLGSEWRDAYRSMGIEIPANAVVDSYGVAHLVPPRETLGAAYHLLEMIHPFERIESLKALESLPWPDPTDPAIYAHLDSEVDRIHSNGRAAIGHMACTIFELSWYLRGMERLFFDLMEGEPVGTWLLDWFTQRAVLGVEAYARAGVDIVLLGDDIGTQRGMLMGVGFWREHFKPRLAKVVAAARRAQRAPLWVAYHSDGDIRPVLDDLIEVGIDILNPVQPECMPLQELVERYRADLAFYGMIGTQTTLPFGTEADVREAVSAIRRWARAGARVIVAPTHVVEPDVPWANLKALVEEAHAPLADRREGR